MLDFFGFEEIFKMKAIGFHKFSEISKTSLNDLCNTSVANTINFCDARVGLLFAFEAETKAEHFLRSLVYDCSFEQVAHGDLVFYCKHSRNLLKNSHCLELHQISAISSVAVELFYLGRG